MASGAASVNGKARNLRPMAGVVFWGVQNKLTSKNLHQDLMDSWLLLKERGLQGGAEQSYPRFGRFV